MSDVIAALTCDHANIAKILELLESEILAIEVGKTPDYPLLQDIMCYMNQYPDRFHHRKIRKLPDVLTSLRRDSRPRSQ